MSLNAKSLSAAVCLLLTIPAHGATLAECSQVSDDRDRLACYDELARETLRGAKPDDSAPPAVIADEPGAAPTPVVQAPVPEPTGRGAEPELPQPAEAPAAVPSNVDESRFGLPARVVEPKKERRELVAAVVAVRSSPLGRLIVELDNDQIWQQVDTSRLTLRVGDQVTIREGLGSAFYLAKSNGSRSLKVRRVE